MDDFGDSLTSLSSVAVNAVHFLRESNGYNCAVAFRYGCEFVDALSFVHRALGHDCELKLVPPKREQVPLRINKNVGHLVRNST